MEEKALAIPAQFLNNTSNACSLYSLGGKTATDTTGALLFRELVQNSTHNPSLRRDFSEMDDGGYWEEQGWQISEDEDIPVHVYVPLVSLLPQSQ
jgi:hypothetical protein